MASVTYDSFKYENSTAVVDLDGDTFKMMLVTSTYVPNVGTHTKRSDVTNEVAGAGYTTGGVTLTGVTVTKDTVNHRSVFRSNDVTLALASITARAAVIYKSHGGASGIDELAFYLDFGTDKTSSSAPFVVQCPADGWAYLA